MMLTEQQKAIAQAIVNVFETGTADGDYGDVTLLAGDPGHLTYGRSQTTLGSGNLYLLIRDYCAAPGAQFASDLKPYQTRLQARDVSLDNDANLKRILRQAGGDEVMQAVQDEFFDRVYWSPAASAAQSLGCVLPLSVAVVYDSHIHGSWQLMRDRTHGNVGQMTTVGEKAWIAAYIKTRQSWLANHSIHILRNTTYRMEAFQALIDAGNWDMEPPLAVRGVTITADKCAPPLKVVLLDGNLAVDCHPKLERDRVRVDMRPLCDAIHAPLPTGPALAALNAVVVPPGVTRVDLRPLVEGNGWEVLTHRMAEDSKIYLRKRA